MSEDFSDEKHLWDQKVVKKKMLMFELHMFKPKPGESEEHAIERLKNMLKKNYDIDVPNDTFIIR